MADTSGGNTHGPDGKAAEQFRVTVAAAIKAKDRQASGRLSSAERRKNSGK